MLRLSDFVFSFPEMAIGQRLADPRDSAGLMVVDRRTEEIRKKNFRDLSNYVKCGDVLVLNDSRVVPARLYGKKKTGGRVEMLILDWAKGTKYKVLTKPGVKVGSVVVFERGLEAKIENIDGDGVTTMVFNMGESELHSLINQIGLTPLPSYIHTNESEKLVRESYQTVYAKAEGSVAAPTAGLHFTPDLIERMEAQGVIVVRIDLHVSLGTFRPVKVDDISRHKMHSEWFELTKENAEIINRAKSKGGRVIAVGTTSARVLESCGDEEGFLTGRNGETAIYIYPPYKFKVTDSLVTNFHLPKSTLLMLVSAFVSRPNTGAKFVNFESSLLGRAYREAISGKYKLFSFGDAMLIK